MISTSQHVDLIRTRSISTLRMTKLTVHGSTNWYVYYIYMLFLLSASRYSGCEIKLVYIYIYITMALW